MFIIAVVFFMVLESLLDPCIVEVPGEVREQTLYSFVHYVMWYLPMLSLTVLETPTEMPSETNEGKQKPRFCLSCTVLLYLPIGALNLNSILGWWKVKLGCIPLYQTLGRVIPVLPLMLSTCLHVGLYSQLLLMDSWTVSLYIVICTICHAYFGVIGNKPYYPQWWTTT